MLDHYQEFLILRCLGKISTKDDKFHAVNA